MASKDKFVESILHRFLCEVEHDARCDYQSPMLGCCKEKWCIHLDNLGVEAPLVCASNESEYSVRATEIAAVRSKLPAYCCLKSPRCVHEASLYDQLKIHHPKVVEAAELEWIQKEFAGLTFRCSGTCGSESTVAFNQLMARIEVWTKLEESKQVSETPSRWEFTEKVTTDKVTYISQGADSTKNGAKYIAQARVIQTLLEKEKIVSELFPYLDWTSIVDAGVTDRNWIKDIKFESIGTEVEPAFRCIVNISNRAVRIVERAVRRTKVEARRAACYAAAKSMTKNGMWQFPVPTEGATQAPGATEGTEEDGEFWLLRPLKFLWEGIRNLKEKIFSFFGGVADTCSSFASISTFVDKIGKMMEHVWSGFKKITRVAADGLLAALGILVLWWIGILNVRMFYNMIKFSLSLLGITIPQEYEFLIENQKVDLSLVFANQKWEAVRQAVKLWSNEYADIDDRMISIRLVRALERPDDLQLIDYLTNFICVSAPDKGKKWSKYLNEVNQALHGDPDVLPFAVKASDAYRQWREDALSMTVDDYQDFTRFEALGAHGLKVPEEVARHLEEKEKEGETQGLQDPLPFLVGIIGAFMGSEWPSDLKSGLKFVKDAAVLGTFASGAKGLVEYAASYCPTIVYYWFCKLFEPGKFKSEEATRVCKQARLLLKYSQSRSDIDTPEFRSDLKEVLEHMEELIEDTQLLKEDRSRLLPFYNKLIQVEILLQSYAAYPNPTRPVPFVIWLSGAPNSGKTVLADSLIHDVYAVREKREIAAVSAGTKHWDDIKPTTKIVRMEEALMVTDDTGEIMTQWLQLVSSAKFVPPMAALPDKGMALEPRGIICTSNYPYPKVDNVDREAVWRRRHMLVDVELSEDCLVNDDGKPDFAKMARKYGSDFCKKYYRHLSFTLMHPYNTNIRKNEYARKQFVSTKMSYREFLNVAQAMYKEHARSQKMLAVSYDIPAYMKERAHLWPIKEGRTQAGDKWMVAKVHGNSWKCDFCSQEVPKEGPKLKEKNYKIEDRELALHGCDACTKTSIVQNGEFWFATYSGNSWRLEGSGQGHVYPQPEYVAGFKANIAPRSAPLKAEVGVKVQDSSEKPKTQRAKKTRKKKGSSSSETDSDTQYEEPDTEPPLPDPEDPYDCEKIVEVAGLFDASLCPSVDQESILAYILKSTVWITSMLLARSAITKLFGTEEHIVVPEESFAKTQSPGLTDDKKKKKKKSRFHKRGGKPISPKRFTRRQQRRGKTHAKDIKHHQVVFTFRDSMSLLGLVHRGFLITNAHQVCGFGPDGQWVPLSGALTVNHMKKNYKGYHYDINTLVDEEADLAFLDIRSMIAPAASLRGFLLSDADFDRLPNYFHVEVLKDGEADGARKAYWQNINVEGIGADKSRGKRRYPNALCYTGVFESGDCGRLVKCISGFAVGKILGFHTAGDSTWGSCSSLTQEDLDIIEEVFDDVDDEPEGETQAPTIPLPILEGPNVERCEYLPRTERPRVNTKSKIKRSEIRVGWEPIKAPAEMTETGELNQTGEHPAEISLQQMADVDIPDELDEPTFERVLRDTERAWRENLVWPVHGRTLSTREAVIGIQKYLSSIQLGTSSGWPLIQCAHSPGKHSFIKIYGRDDDRIVEFSPELEGELSHWREYLVSDDVEAFNNLDPRFCAYMKDELLKRTKVEKGAVRFIFACPLPLWILMREQIGTFMAAVHNSWETNTCAIGCNPLSSDMDKMFKNMTSKSGCEKFFAGDYKGWDRRLLRKFMQGVNRIISNICEDMVEGFEPRVFEKLTDVILEAPIAFDSLLFSFRNGEKSGHPLTGIYNSMCNEMYFRYAFLKIAPTEDFDKSVGVKFVGDDNIVTVREDLQGRFNDLSLSYVLREDLGQIYTAADKVSELTGEFVDFKDVTFLGCHPRKFKGKWFGALDKDIIREMVLWRKTGHDTDYETCVTAVRAMSAWGREEFSRFKSQILAGTHDKMLKNDLPKIRWSEAIEGLVNANAGTEGDWALFGWFQAPGDQKSDEGSKKSSLATFKNPLQKRPVKDRLRKHVPARPDLMKEKKGDLEIGLRTPVHRATVTWNASEETDSIIWHAQVPWGLLDLNVSDVCETKVEIQNMPFENYNFVRFKTKIGITCNGLPNQGGMCMLVWRPLIRDSGYLGAQCDWRTKYTMQKVKILPQENAYQEMELPFVHPRQYLNPFAKEEADETLGKLELVVVAPLSSGAATIKIYSSFEDTDMRMVKQPGTASNFETALENGLCASEFKEERDRLKLYKEQLAKRRVKRLAERKKQFGVEERAGMVKLNRPRFVSVDEVEKMLEGTSVSGKVREKYGYTQGNTVSQTKTVNIGTIIGDVNDQDQMEGDATQDIDAEADLEVPPPTMHYPKCAGGSVPTWNQMPGMSRSHGLQPTLSMQLSQKTIRKTRAQTFGCASDEANIQSLMARECIAETFTWSEDQVEGTLLYTAPSTPCPKNFLGSANETRLSLQEYVAQNFLFWKGTIKMNISAYVNAYQTGRLKWVCVYASPALPSYVSTAQQLFQELNFGSGQQEHEVSIEFLASTEFLMTPRGLLMVDPVQNSILGYWGLFVSTPLKASSNIASNSCLVVISVKYDGVLAVPAPIQQWYHANRQGSAGQTIQFKGAPVAEDELEGKTQGPEPKTENREGQKTDQGGAVGLSHPAAQDEKTEASHSAVTQVLKGSKEPRKPRMGKEDLRDSCFNYPVASMLDLARRYHRTEPSGTSTVGDKRVQVFIHSCPDMFWPMFRGWKGGLHYRVESRGNYQVAYFPDNMLPFDVADLASEPALMDLAWIDALIAMGRSQNFNPITESFNFGGGDRDVQADTFNGLSAIEIGNGRVGDYEVPFQSIFEFLYTGNFLDVENSVAGLFFVISNSSADDPVVWTRVADDFQVGVYSPIDIFGGQSQMTMRKGTYDDEHDLGYGTWGAYRHIPGTV